MSECYVPIQPLIATTPIVWGQRLLFLKQESRNRMKHFQNLRAQKKLIVQTLLRAETISLIELNKFEFF